MLNRDGSIWSTNVWFIRCGMSREQSEYQLNWDVFIRGPIPEHKYLYTGIVQENPESKSLHTARKIHPDTSISI